MKANNYRRMLKAGLITLLEYSLLISSKKQRKELYNLIDEARKLRESSLLRRIYDLG
jgi:hypothetical protein